MRKYRNLLFYVLTLGGFSILIFILLTKGKALEKEKATHFVPQIQASTWSQFKDTYSHNLTHPLSILLLQIIVVILVARVFGFICIKIRQPTVVGEIAAGIFLGPSFLKSWFPEVSNLLFPPNSLSNLQFLSQIGLILFMFVIGMELDLKVLRNKATDAIVVSHASIIFPFTLGITLAYFIYQGYAPANINFLSFALFIGIAMSITAFPVLARIVQERGLTRTRLGAIVITCAAADDITAWCILAVVIAIVKAGSIISSFYSILMAIAYVFIMLKFVRPFLKRVGDKYSNKESLNKQAVTLFFVTLVLSSWATEVIGIHALFGAFMAGVIMPDNMSFRNVFIEKVEDVAVVLLLPLFFVFTGLRTQIGLLGDGSAWGICLAIIGVAVVGKFLGSALAARFVGQTWRDSLAIGALMNTRGLMELIVLNIGFDLGVLTPQVFAMMVIMAVTTTIMTGPAMNLIERFSKSEIAPEPIQIPKIHPYRILISFANAAKGIALLKLAALFAKSSAPEAPITALHVSLSDELNQYNQEEYEQENFLPVKAAAAEMQLPVETIFKPTFNIGEEVVNTANRGQFDLLLIDTGSSIFEGTLLGRILGFTNKIINPERLYDTITGKERFFDHDAFDEQTRHIIRASKVPVAIFVDRGADRLNSITIPILSMSDSFLLLYARKLMNDGISHLRILDVDGVIARSPEFTDSIHALEQFGQGRIAIDKKSDHEQSDSRLVLVSIDSWRKSLEQQSEWLSGNSSLLIIKP